MHSDPPETFMENTWKILMRSIHAAESYVKSNDTNHLTTGIPIPGIWKSVVSLTVAIRFVYAVCDCIPHKK